MSNVINIACIEDEPILRQNLSEILRDSGYSVRDFNDGAEALEYMQTVQSELCIPKLVIADINMPKMTGLELVRRMRTIGSAYSSTPIMLLTALSKAQYQTKAHDLNVQEYLLKPIDYNLLLAKVEQYVGPAH